MLGPLAALLTFGALVAPVFACDPASRDPVIETDTLRVVTLNVAHGRKDRMNQMLLGEETIRENLVAVGEFLNNLDADVIALQEADAASRWSGRFDHVAFLADALDMPCTLHARHAKGRWYDFGTALLAKAPFADSIAHDFQPSRPTTRKGFVLGRVRWQAGRADATLRSVSVVSVHLDFSRRSVREAQVAEMIGVLSEIDGSLVVMGDFNADWSTEDSSVRRLAEALDLHAYAPQQAGLGTYDGKDDRLDWILLSQDLGFASHSVRPEIVSDHLAVLAEVEYRGSVADPVAGGVK
jgi:endonuclease/exonuclease/phosphatase family metal-dependent hydrolase